MKGSLVAVALLLVTLLTFGTATTLAEETKTKVIVLVDRDVVCPEDPVTLYSGGQTFRVTGEIKGITIKIIRSCPCTLDFSYNLSYEGSYIQISKVIDDNRTVHTEYTYAGPSNNYHVDFVVLAEKGHSTCETSHIIIQITVEYTGDWVESPKGSQRNGQRGGRAPLSPIGAVVIAATLIALGAKRK